MNSISRTYCMIVCLLMVGTVFGGVMNVSAAPTLTVSDEIMFWDDFETSLTKWTPVVNPGTNVVERSNLFSYTAGYDPDGIWESWYIRSDLSLHIRSNEIPNGVAYVTSQSYSTSDDYIIQFTFCPPTNFNARFKVVDDGNVLLTIDHTNTLVAYDGAIPVVIGTMLYPTWYSFEIKVHVSSSTYDVYFDNNWVGTFNMVTIPYNYMILGDDSYASGYFGEGYWDNVKVAKLQPIIWGDDFNDGTISDWTTVVSTGNDFDISTMISSSPPFCLYMYGQIGSSTEGLYSYGFTPNYDLPPNRNYKIQFQFYIHDINNYRVVAMADGYVNLVVDDDWLKAYIDESNVIDIVRLPLNVWIPIELEVYPATMDYDVYVNTVYYGRYGFVQEPMYKKVPSNLFMGVNFIRDDIRHGSAFWDDIYVISNHPPSLDWTREYNYVSDGLHPQIGFKDVTPFEYRIDYTDLDNDPPQLNYPKVDIYDGPTPIGSYPMIEVDPLDLTYTDGKLYYYPKIYSNLGNNYRYEFNAKDAVGTDAPTIGDYGPEVIEFHDSEDWWMFHHDEHHTGYSTSVVTDSPRVIWDFKTSHWIRSNPAVVDGMVFFASIDHHVYAVNEYTGKEIWRYYTLANVDWSSPAVADGMVFIGCTDGKVYALDQFTGSLIWTYQTAGMVESSPVVADGMVFVGSEDNNVYALNQYTGAYIWHYPTASWGVLSSCAVANGKVFVGTEGPNGRVYALNEYTGSYVWSYTTGDTVFSSPAIAEGMVFIGSHDGKIYALDENNGNQIWNYQTGDIVYSSPAVVNGVVYVGSHDNKIYALNEFTGGLIWDYDTDGDVLSSPAVADGKVIVASYDDVAYKGTLYAINKVTGAKIWDYSLTGATFWSSPSVADGMVFIGTTHFSPSVHSYLYAFV